MQIVPGFKEMKPFTKVVSILTIYGFIPTMLANGVIKDLFFAAQISSLFMMLYLSKTNQYWK
jgi:hypothetical protein